MAFFWQYCLAGYFGLVDKYHDIYVATAGQARNFWDFGFLDLNSSISFSKARLYLQFDLEWIKGSL